jgi:hypothetical protein
MKVTHSIGITLANGHAATHTAELLGVRHEGDGSCVATAACCGLVGATMTCQGCNGSGCGACQGKGSIKDEDTRSHMAFYDIASLSSDEILAKVQGHVERVAQHHAGAHKAKEFIASLTQPDAAAALGHGKVG